MTAPRVILSIQESDKMLPKFIAPMEFFGDLTRGEQLAILEIAIHAMEYEVEQDPLLGFPILDVDLSNREMRRLTDVLYKYMDGRSEMGKYLDTLCST